MSATIKLTFEENGVKVDRFASFDGERWTSEDKFAADMLNAYAKHWRLQTYYPDPIAGVALEVAAALPEVLKAEFVHTDPIDYSEEHDDTVY